MRRSRRFVPILDADCRKKKNVSVKHIFEKKSVVVFRWAQVKFVGVGYVAISQIFAPVFCCGFHCGSVRSRGCGFPGKNSAGAEALASGDEGGFYVTALCATEEERFREDR